MYRFVLACVVNTFLVSWTQADDGSTYSKVAMFHHTQAVAESVREIRISNRVGDIAVVAADGDQMTVEADVHVDTKRIDASKAGKRFEDHALLHDEDNVITITDAHKEESSGTPWKIFLRIGLPRRLQISARTGVGNIRVEFAKGRISLKTGVGDIALNVDGIEAVRAEAGVGKLDLQLGTVSGDVSATVGTGNVGLQTKSSASKVEAKSGTGDVTVKFLTPDAGRETLIETGVGTAVLELPEDASGKFELGVSVGSVDLVPPGALELKPTLTGATASGQIGENGRKYKVTSGVGSVRLRLDTASEHPPRSASTKKD